MNCSAEKRTLRGMLNTIYLDYNATAPMRPDVQDLMTPLLGQPLNASSVHAYGREGKRLIDTARRQVAALTGADANNVIFNSGATEGGNTVLKHFSAQKVAVSAMDHPSVRQARQDAILLPVTPGGEIDLNTAEALIKDHKPALVSCQAVNSETGIIQPIAKLSQIARANGAYFHSDAVQAAGRIPLNMMELGLDFLTLSAHKIGGPQGVGALVLGLCGETPTLLDGGGQEKKARAGTENVAGIAGFGLAAELALADLSAATLDARQALRDDMEAQIQAIIPNVNIYGRDQDARRVYNTSFFSVPGASSQTLLMAFDLEGICVSNGSACSSGTVQPSATLKAMGASDEDAMAALRVSIGWNTTQADIDAFLEALKKITARL
ncbi:MAG: cysteine desulfurase [Micavibrio sp.]|nr:cysteine desulfurase [Micavibrio sp.]